MWSPFKSTEENERKILGEYVRRRIGDIRGLKDFAISNNIAIDADRLAEIGEITISDPASWGDQSVPQSGIADVSTRCDRLYVLLSEAIHDYYGKKNESFSLRSIIMVRDHVFFGRMLKASLVILALTVGSWVIINALQLSGLKHCGQNFILSVYCSLEFGLLVRSIFAVSLGCLGSMLYLILNILGFGEGRDTREFETPSAIMLRVILGGLVGWLAFVAVFDFPSVSLFAGDLQGPEAFVLANDTGALKFFIAFVAGFSTRLVVGVLGKMVSTVAQALSVDGFDKPGKT